jgi:hypothetical protein
MSVLFTNLILLSLEGYFAHRTLNKDLLSSHSSYTPLSWMDDRYDQWQFIHRGTSLPVQRGVIDERLEFDHCRFQAWHSYVARKDIE